MATVRPDSRSEMLRDGLRQTVDHLKQRRADLIDAGVIADYVALNWLEWHGGSLRLTIVGGNVCKQMAPAPTN
ncbi:hypothetical protein [Methylibium sp.]|uniref:hypothetical protein n=1 Tax=Methylibium sp. TaxID=2067992 RepID=UPI003D0E4B88